MERYPLKLSIFAFTRIMKKMKKSLTTLLIALASFLAVVGCSKHNTDEFNTDEYYVKYVFTCQVVQYGKIYPTPYTVYFTDSNLQEQSRSFKSGEEESVICGPFKYGNEVKLSLEHFYHDNVGGSSSANTFLEIYVSKNNSPFALRKSVNNSSQNPQTTTLEYTIDY